MFLTLSVINMCIIGSNWPLLRITWCIHYWMPYIVWRGEIWCTLLGFGISTSLTPGVSVSEIWTMKNPWWLCASASYDVANYINQLAIQVPFDKCCTEQMTKNRRYPTSYTNNLQRAMCLWVFLSCISGVSHSNLNLVLMGQLCLVPGHCDPSYFFSHPPSPTTPFTLVNTKCNTNNKI